MTASPAEAAGRSVILNAAGSVATLRERMQELGAAAYLSFDPDNQNYLTGFRAQIYSRPLILFITAGSSALIVPELEEAHSRPLAQVDEILVYGERPDADAPASHAPLLESLLRGLQADARVAVDAERLPLVVADLIRSGGRETVPFDHVLRSMRSVKRADELAAMHVAGELAEIGLSASIQTARTGVSELEVDAAGDAAIYGRAAELGADTTVNLLVLSPSGSRRSTLPHVFSTPRLLAAGDIVIHSRQVAVEGYRAELERTLIIGEPSSAQRNAFDVMCQAQQAAIEAVRPGVAMCDVDAAARSVIADAGYGEYAVHRTGHGIGIGVHEQPFLRFDNVDVLEPGMVVTIEPGFYVPGLGGFRHSDTLAVTESGSELLTEYPRSLEALVVT